MKQTFLKLAASGAVAAGLMFAQAPAQTTPSTPSQQDKTQSKETTRPKTRAERREAFRERMFAELNLTPAQREKANVLFRQERQTLKPIHGQLMENREAMATAVRANNKAEIQRLASQAGELTGKMIAVRSETMAKFYTTLTPTQRAKAEQIQQRFHERRHPQQRSNG